VLELAFTDDSYAYRPGRSVLDAVARIRNLREAGYAWVVDGDIERFFDRVPHAPLLAALETHVDDPALMDLIALWLEQAGPEGIGLPQGSPLSPLLSNLYLDDLDDAAQEAAFGPGVRLVRYADDFVLLCRTEERARAVLHRVDQVLAHLGLSLNRDKTRVVSFDAGFRFLGHLFVKSMVLPSPRRDQDGGEALLRALAQRDEREAAEDARQAAEENAGLSPVTRVLYVMERGRTLALRNQSLTVMEGETELLALSPGRVGRVEIGPAAGFEDEALRACLMDGIPVHMVDGAGQTRGACLPPTLDRAGLHLAQARLALDPDARADVARVLAGAKIHNQRSLLRRLNRSLKDGEVAKVASRIGRLLRKLPLQGDAAAIMGVEGEAAALYWPALARLLRDPWRLDRRLRRPPPDPVNLVLSWLSALLTRDLETLVVRHGLHPGFAVLHGIRDHHQGCVYDLMEPLRGPLVEALAMTLFNQKHLKVEHFDQSDPTHCRILPEGRREVIRGWEAWLDKPIRSPRSGHHLTWRGLMEEEILAFVRQVTGGEPFAPYRMDY
jgi:CRISPR-associated protein Cas1